MIITFCLLLNANSKYKKKSNKRWRKKQALISCFSFILSYVFRQGEKEQERKPSNSPQAIEDHIVFVYLECWIFLHPGDFCLDFLLFPSEHCRNILFFLSSFMLYSTYTHTHKTDEANNIYFLILINVMEMV